MKNRTKGGPKIEDFDFYQQVRHGTLPRCRSLGGSNTKRTAGGHDSSVRFYRAFARSASSRNDLWCLPEIRCARKRNLQSYLSHLNGKHRKRDAPPAQRASPSDPASLGGKRSGCHPLFLLGLQQSDWRLSSQISPLPSVYYVHYGHRNPWKMD